MIHMTKTTMFQKYEKENLKEYSNVGGDNFIGF